MSSLNIKFKKTAEMLEDCRNFARFTQTTVQPHFHNSDFILHVNHFNLASKKGRKEMISRNEKKIKTLKMRLKHYSYLMEIRNNPDNVKLFEPYYFGVESVKGKIKYLISLAKKNYGYRNVFKDFDNRYLILVKQEIDGFPVEITPFSILEDVLNQYNLYKQYHGSNSSRTT